MSAARRALFTDDRSVTKAVPLTPTPPSRPAALAAEEVASGTSNISPIHPRSSKKAYDEARLDNPFDHRRNEYHTSQQTSLNAELRGNVERVTSEWERVVQTTRIQLDQLPERASAMNYMAYNGLTAYDEGYHCTEDLPMAEERLVTEFRYLCGVEMLKDIQALPPINVGSVGNALDSLLTSNKLLAHLDVLKKEISPLDAVGEVDVSSSALALHEKFHYPVGEESRQELAKNIIPMQAMEDKLMAEKTLKELALESRDVPKAGECLINQVEISNELLKLNHIRMEIVQLLADDVAEFDRESVKLLETVQSISESLDERLDSILQPLQKDIENCTKDKQIAEQQLAANVAAFAKEQSDARMKFKEMEANEHKLWKQACDLLTELELATSDKKQFIWQRLLAKEKASRQQHIEMELIRSQENHLTRLQLCEDFIISAQRAAQQFATFKDTFDVNLRDRVCKHYDDLHNLQLRESSEYVRRFELFAFGAEEVRAKKQSRLDVMHLTQRNLLMDIDSAENTLDPFVAKYREEVKEIEEETTKIEQYMAYVQEMQDSRKAEVEPATKLVSTFVAQQKMQQKRLKLTPGSAATCRSSLASPKALSDTVGTEANLSDIGGPDDSEMPELDDEEIVHPQIAARHLGLMHEENVTLRAHDYVREELAAIESRMSDIRMAKTVNQQRMRSAQRVHEVKSTSGKSTPLIFIPGSQ